jgi:hypothetical protein
VTPESRSGGVSVRVRRVKDIFRGTEAESAPEPVGDGLRPAVTVKYFQMLAGRFFVLAFRK